MGRLKKECQYIMERETMQTSIEGFKKASKKEQGITLMILGGILIGVSFVLGIISFVVGYFSGIMSCLCSTIDGLFFLGGLVLLIIGVVFYVSGPSTPAQPPQGGYPPTYIPPPPPGQ